MKHDKQVTRKLLIHVLQTGCCKETRNRIWERLQYIDKKNK